ncbi:MAG: hypothetical protein ACRC8Y_06550 [Chroococcales cyanobacterium]
MSKWECDRDRTPSVNSPRSGTPQPGIAHAAGDSIPLPVIWSNPKSHHRTKGLQH